MVLWVLAWMGCTPECGPEQCAAICDPNAAQPVAPEPTPSPAPGQPQAPSAFEQGILDWVLQDIRTGVRPAGEQAVGLCRGKRDCDKFLGTEAGKLTRGSYWVRAQLLVPPGPPGTWKVVFSSECAAPSGEVRSFEREFDVLHAGPGQATTVNLRAFSVPSDDGPQSCTWKLVAKDPKGDHTYAGSWEHP